MLKRTKNLLLGAFAALVFVVPAVAQHTSSREYAVSPDKSYRPEAKHTLWYTLPATAHDGVNQWEEYSLPLGNGQLGASIFGGVKRDEIVFNEKTLWSGTSRDNAGYDDYGHYECFGSVYIEDLSEAFSMDGSRPVRDYHRELDLTTATARVAYSSADGAVKFSREYISSYPDKVIVARYKASREGALNLRFTMVSSVAGDQGKTSYSSGEATFGGKLQTITYNARLKVVPQGGVLSTDANGITLKGADECLLILAGGTDFDAYVESFTSGTATLPQQMKQRADKAAQKGWDAIYKAHTADYQSLFNRVKFDLASKNTMPTDELIDNYYTRQSGKEPEILMLEELYFAFGRYLAISSSRGVDLPSNLQGIWNNSKKPAWNCDIHSNINVQMNYWPMEHTNLSELHLPFLNYIINMATNHESWKRYAKESGQERGWTCYTENNIFGGVGGFAHQYVIANAWYCTHLWQHYLYTLDEKFLSRAFPAMLSATQFWMDRLIVDKDGLYVCPQEFSPEQGPTEDGIPHAQQLVCELFDNTLKAVEVLGVKKSGIDPKELKLIQDRYAKLDRGLRVETYDGAWGENLNGIKKGDKILREWKHSPYTAGYNGHRHISHAMCMYPFSQLEQGSEEFEAMKNSLLMRGDASTGWSMGWKINLWARALDGDHAHDILELAVSHYKGAPAKIHKGTSENLDRAGGISYNLYDQHPPFQIDGNFGATAGIAEMLMQSHSGAIHLLPALPEVWAEGSISGMKAIGDFEVSICWANNKATSAQIVNNQGQPCTVKCAGLDKAQITVNGKPAKAKALASDTFVIKSKAGDKISIKF
jgi:alpha-L-fucosidase 2